MIFFFFGGGGGVRKAGLLSFKFKRNELRHFHTLKLFAGS